MSRPPADTISRSADRNHHADRSKRPDSRALAEHPEETGGRASRRSAPPPRGKRNVALLALGALVIGALIAGNGLVSCSNQQSAAKTISRPVTSAEATRLAGVRLADYTLGHSAIAVTIGTGTGAIHMTGWVDWRQPLIYLNSVSAADGDDDGLLQAVPGVVAIRPGRYTPPAAAGQVDPYPAPPIAPPPTGWQIRPITPGSAIDTTITLLFALRSATADDAGQIAAIGSKFVGTDEIGGHPVDIIDGAAVPPPAATKAPVPSPSELPFAAEGGQVRYWVDAHSQLLRAEALVNPTTKLEIDFDRTDRTDPNAIELLGGSVIHPTKVTTSQAKLLAGMRLRDFTSGGGTVTMAVPVSQTALYSATGWLDWRTQTLYVTVRNNKTSAPDAILRVDVAGVTVHGAIDTGTAAAIATPSSAPLLSPTLHPRSSGWKRTPWAKLEDKYGLPDLYLLANELLALTAVAPDNPAGIKPVAARLRRDEVDGTPVTVYEIRQPSETKVPMGQSRLRFWVDRTGLLRRLELRTRTGAYAYVTITGGRVPTLPDPIPMKFAS
ncbi:MAG TPA: hypothetical protein VGF84_01445 [Micromonosporaceae bacterium]